MPHRPCRIDHAASNTRLDPEDRKKIGDTVIYLRNKHDWLRYDTALASRVPDC